MTLPAHLQKLATQELNTCTASMRQPGDSTPPADEEDIYVYPLLEDILPDTADDFGMALSVWP